MERKDDEKLINFCGRKVIGVNALLVPIFCNHFYFRVVGTVRSDKKQANGPFPFQFVMHAQLLSKY